MIVRKDLSTSQQAVQACHGAIEIARSLAPEEEHPHVVLLSVRSEEQLFNALNRLQAEGIDVKTFVEPDIGNQLTAIAAGPVFGETRRHFKRYQLLGCGNTPFPTEESTLEVIV